MVRLSLLRRIHLRSGWFRAGSAILLFAINFAAFNEVVPLSPRAVLNVSDDAPFLQSEMLRFSPDSSMLITVRSTLGQPAGPLRVWDVQAAKERFSVGPPWTSVETAVFSADSRLLAAHEVLEGNGNLGLWDARTGKELARLGPWPAPQKVVQLL
jgi:hypothetical protein